ncbi:GNAT family N-acetyltransferase [Polymorphum gilvum]|uniref:Acetyltransferase, GNAT family n=1 Tax=Polymorphum gilvum (strain LMG 25793 / CGMCC 1.9160 / SL003B-26A1) TaxID=991905 RepID=F2IWS2_POLGS|nr:GNAT family N-acetyltransferase [Polymorphum gilvum]ADZ70396.1 Acetyltransferase, GNAT family [Polymorphum gilvum SL003B-26A1]
MDAGFRIAPMSADDLRLALDWAANEGWNPGRDDAEAFMAADPGGFLMGFLGDEPITSISVVAYGDAFGFLGCYICAPGHRGKGYGWATWQAGMARLGTRAVGLDGVVAQQDAYRKSGFALAHRNIRYGGLSTADTPVDPRVVRAGQGLFASLRNYDRAVFQAPREAFLKAWLDPMAPSRRAFALVEDGTLTGYGTIRACLDGFKIGPLFADTEAGADLLFRALAGQVRGSEIYLDPPEPNAAAIALAERYDLSPVFETARMYKDPAPEVPLARVFGITSFELG